MAYTSGQDNLGRPAQKAFVKTVHLYKVRNYFFNNQWFSVEKVPFPHPLQRGKALLGADTLRKEYILNWISNERFVSFRNGRMVVLAEIMADTAGDLPDAEDITGRILARGSTALDINTGDRYCLNSSGLWKKQNSASSLGTSTSAIISCTSAGAPVVGDLTEQEEE